MKKIMWIVAMIPVVVTSVVLQFMPDIIPMHHDLSLIHIYLTRLYG